MLDGQGYLLPLHHPHREYPSHSLSSWADNHKCCRAESSAESSPNPSAYPFPQHSRPHAVCSCSLDASESNIGELVTLNPSKSVVFSCFPVSVAKVELAQLWDRNGEVAEEVTLPSTSSELDCLSTGHSRSLSPAQVVEMVPLSVYGELDEVCTSLCTSCHRSSEMSRSRGRLDQFSCSSEMRRDLMDSTACNNVAEEKSVETATEGGSNSETAKFEDAEVSKCKEHNSVFVSSSAPTVISFKWSGAEHNPGLVSFFPKDLKELEECSSQSVCTEEILLKESTTDFLDTQNASSEFACALICKRLRIKNSHMAVWGGGSLGAHRKVPTESQRDNTSQQQQPYLPGLDNESALRCFAFVPLFDLGLLAMLGRQYRDLVKSRLIFKLRRMYGMVEHLVFVYASPTGRWTAYDANHNAWRTLPLANVNPNFNLQDRESLSAGTHVLWLGKEMFDFVYYRYDLVTNSWERGPSMVNPRCLFASASCGDYAYVAGGFGPANSPGALTLLNSAERYNSDTGEWERLPPMCKARHKCSGFFMDGKFYVIGGRDANHQPIMSGEEYNPVTGLWRKIPNMYFAPEVPRRDMFEPSPPLVAVVNNHLYAVEHTTNILKMYNKLNNTWSSLGNLPVRVDFRNGWGVAFKALGNRLFVMGDLDGIAAYCWRPGPNPTEPIWELLCRRERGAGSFLYNCAVMTC
ncbi:hypothetical protein L7F22_040635 [Adiantum nelumboides]|nr:hypothetical protein [Adiantum nelumboides]